MVNADHAHASPIVVTPGSMAGYSFFPPASSSGSGSTPGGGDELDTLQRCLWAPGSGDQTVKVIEHFGYNKEISMYYTMVGGDGGAGIIGGGGGSSAILRNGSPVAIGPGADGGKTAKEVNGVIKIKKGDTLRFLTGGSGGAGNNGGYYGNAAIGGGGGAGYKGGGGGGSLTNRKATAADTPGITGKGGGSTPGPGGL